MAEDLWKLRKSRRLTVQQLAAKAGIALAQLEAYEQGEPVRAADLGRLAKSLFVDEFDIKVRSTPRPAGRSKPEHRSRPPQPARPQSAPPNPTSKKVKPVPLARPSQITHLLSLARKMGQDETAVTAEAGQQLANLTEEEAKRLLITYTERLQAYKSDRPSQAETDNVENRPPGTRRRRAYLPEAVDIYELNYLQTRQAAGDVVCFTLLSGQQFTGQVMGFSPYNITVRQSNGIEITIQKLALAYYQLEPSA